MEQKTCDKITTEVLKEAVSKEHGVPVEAISIENINITAGSKLGEGFACEIAAVKFFALFDGQRLGKNYIAKYGPEGSRGEFVKEMKIFDKETETYTYLIPKLQEIRSHKSLKPLAFAKCFYASAKDELLILENMKAQNFVVIRKKPEPLTLNAIKIVLHELAAYHATAHHFLNTFPGGKDGFAEEYKRLFDTDFFDNTSIGGDKIVDMICQMFETSVYVIGKTGTSEMAEKMVSYQKVVNSDVKNILRSKSSLSYIVHGDAWYNNFLFRYSPQDQNEPKDVIIIDLQGTRFGRAGIELVYFFCSSTSPEQRKGHFDELLRYYYDAFFEELKSLGDDSEPFFSFDDLKKEYDECYPFGFAMGFAHSQALLVSEDSKDKIDSEFLGSEEDSTRMLEALKVKVLESVNATPEYRKLFIGLAEEGLEKKVL